MHQLQDARLVEFIAFEQGAGPLKLVLYVPSGYFFPPIRLVASLHTYGDFEPRCPRHLPFLFLYVYSTNRRWPSAFSSFFSDFPLFLSLALKASSIVDPSDYFSSRSFSRRFFGVLFGRLRFFSPFFLTPPYFDTAAYRPLYFFSPSSSSSFLDLLSLGLPIDMQSCLPFVVGNDAEPDTPHGHFFSDLFQS